MSFQLVYCYCLVMPLHSAVYMFLLQTKYAYALLLIPPRLVQTPRDRSDLMIDTDTKD
jgi:hypothetical protein